MSKRLTIRKKFYLEGTDPYNKNTLGEYHEEDVQMAKQATQKEIAKMHDLSEVDRARIISVIDHYFGINDEKILGKPKRSEEVDDGS